MKTKPLYIKHKRFYCLACGSDNMKLVLYNGRRIDPDRTSYDVGDSIECLECVDCGARFLIDWSQFIKTGNVSDIRIL